MSSCDVCYSDQPLVYLVVWLDEEKWLCDACFQANMCCIARQAGAIYYLPTCAQVTLTVLEEEGS